MDEQYTPIDLVLDSGDRSSGNKDYPSFTLSPPIEDVVGATVFYANVPFTYDVVDYTNNVCQLVKDPLGVNTEQLFTLTIGTYTSTNILTELTERLQDSGLSGAANFKFFIESDTNRLMIYNATAGATSNFQWKTTSSRTSAAILGFEPDQTYAAEFGSIIDENDLKTGNVYYVRSPFSINLSGSGQMYLHCPQLQGYLKGAIRSGPNMSDIVGFWPVNANFLNYIIYQNSIPAVVPFTQTTISSLDFYLTIGSRRTYGEDANSVRKYISLKGQTFQIGIRFYKRNGEFIQAYIDSTGDRGQRVTSTGGQSRYF